MILAHDPSPESGGALAVRGCDCKPSYDRPSRARPIGTTRTSEVLEIVEGLEAALSEFAAIAESLRSSTPEAREP